MKYYKDILELGCFSREGLISLITKPYIANNIIYEYQKKGLIQQVKRDYYVPISLETNQPISSRYQIASNIFPDACLSHHSAFEVHGYANQVFYECYVATEKRFLDFTYNGINYQRVEKKKDLDVEQKGDIKVTSLEQTVIDSIRDYEKISGLEEVLRCIVLIPELSEEKVLNCLSKNNNGFLYQKCGYIFSELNNEFHFSTNFFDECKKHSSNAKRYLIKGLKDSIYQEEWKLYTPLHLSSFIDKGVNDYDAIG